MENVQKCRDAVRASNIMRMFMIVDISIDKQKFFAITMLMNLKID